jgi:hypothetical protein
MGATIKHSRKAKLKGLAKKRRRHRLQRREATKEVREAHNAKMRALGHPGWARTTEPMPWNEWKYEDR